MASQERDPVVLLDTDVAEELLDLVTDEPGLADEDLLDEALEAVEEADGQLDGEQQQMVASGEAVAFGLSDDEADAVTTLVKDNEESRPRSLRSVAGTLRGKLRAARKKARRR